MELPETFRKPLEYISRNVLFDQAGPFIPENDTLMPHGNWERKLMGKLALATKEAAGLSC